MDTTLQTSPICHLEHPVVEMRTNVIHTVSMKDLKLAIPQLEHTINKESSPIVLMAMVDALGRMSHPEAIEILRRLSNHTYPVIRSRSKVHKISFPRCIVFRL